MKFPMWLWAAAGILPSCISSLVLAQTPAAAGAPVPAPAPAQPSSDATGGAAATGQSLDYIYNRSPEEGSAGEAVRDQAAESKTLATSKQGALDSLAGMESLLSPDFERFLSAEEVPKEKMDAYLAQVSQVLSALRQRKPADAFEGLNKLSESPWDGDLSLQIANRVRAVWDSSTTARAIAQQNQNLEGEVRSANWNVDIAADEMKRHSQDGGSSKNIAKGQLPGAGDVTSGAAPGVAGTMRMTQEYFRSLDAKAKIKLNEVRMGDLHTKAKADLEAYVSTLMDARQFLHAYIAAEFYQALFWDGELPPSLAKLSTGALEARRKIAGAVDVFKFKVDQQQLVSATEILKGAYALSETTPEMLGLERHYKLPVVSLANSIRRMRNLIETRDYAELGNVLTQLEKQASDLDTTKPRELIRTAQLEARMRLGNAKLAAQKGDQGRALAEFKAAAQVWPGNPELKDLSDQFFKTQDVANEGIDEFDRLSKDANYRRIAEKQLVFANVLANDAVRLEQLKKALQIVQSAQAAIEKAKIYSLNNDSAGAWEQVELAARDWKDDNELNRLRVEYSKAVAEFVATLDKAENAEKQKNYGYGLSCYLQAQQLYRGSQIAHDGIDRLKVKVLKPKDEKDEAAAGKKEAGKPAPAEGDGRTASSTPQPNP